MPEIPNPDASTPIVDENGVMTDAFQRLINQLIRLDLIVGTGSPETVIPATVGRLYMDDSGSSGSLLYQKKLADIGGDDTQGWIAV